MKYTLIFGTLALSLAWSASQSDFWAVQLLFASGAVCFGGVALAYAGAGPRVFLKGADGRLGALSWAIFWPFHALNRAALLGFVRRQKRSGALVSAVTGKIFLGPRLHAAQVVGALGSRDFAVLDVAGELAEDVFLRRAHRYLSLPVLDTGAPTMADLQTGVAWMQEHENAGPVYVHCALGHGRSATFVAAFLLKSGRAATAGEAVDLIRHKRPGIGLSAAQRRVLEQFEVST